MNTPKKSVKQPPKKKPGRSPVDRMRTKLERALTDLETLRTDVGETARAVTHLQDNTLKNLETLGTVSAHNSKVLCDYVDDIADRLYGLVTVMEVYTDSMAGIIEERHGKEEGWAPRVTEELVIVAAQQHREERLADYQKRREAAEQDPQPGNVTPMRPMDAMTDEELAKMTEEKTADPTVGYPQGTQFFGK